MRYFITFLLVTSLFVSCKKDEDQTIIDEEIILAYLHDNDLEAEATKDASGMYYIIYNEGTGGHPTTSSTVEVKYKGYLTDGYVFDQTLGSSTVSFPLTNLIEGWKIGIPMLQKGGNGLFLLLSALGYGSANQSEIPANSVLIFEITLVDF
jgi:FKBP-type peptidyl-prolyl cis-trans isomerase FkpA